MVDETKLTDPNLDFNKLPWISIDCIISNKNIFINLKHNDPSKIYYHIHTSDEWEPFI